MSHDMANGTAEGAGRDALSGLVGDRRVLERHWEHSPATMVSDLDPDAVFPLETAMGLWDRSGLPASFFRVFAGGEPVPQAEFSLRRARPAAGREPTADGRSLRSAFEGGATVVFEEVRTVVAEVDDLAGALERELGFRLYCAAFLTQAGNSGVRPHYDLSSGLLWQVHGSKNWAVGAPGEYLPTAPSGDSVGPFDPVFETALRPRQVLYIPRGHPHAGAATGEASLHLSFAVHPFTWKDLIQSQLRESVSDDAALREMLPLGHHRTRSAGELLEEALARLPSKPRFTPPVPE